MKRILLSLVAMAALTCAAAPAMAGERFTEVSRTVAQREVVGCGTRPAFAQTRESFREYTRVTTRAVGRARAVTRTSARTVNIRR